MSLLDFLLTGFSKQIDALTKFVDRSFDHVNAVLALNSQALLRLEKAVQAMPTRAEFDAAKAVLLQSITDAAARVSTDIQALRDQLANGNPVTDQDLADLQGDITAVGAIDPVAVPPPTP